MDLSLKNRNNACEVNGGFYVWGKKYRVVLNHGESFLGCLCVLCKITNIFAWYGVVVILYISPKQN